MKSRALRMAAFEVSGWHPLEVAWLIATCLAIALASLWQRESPISVVSAVTGIAYVVLAGKGKLSAYVFGVINVVSYSCIAAQVLYYGEVVLNMLCYLPLMFIGFVMWSRNMDEGTGEVSKRALSATSRLTVGIVSTLLTVAGAFVLRVVGDPLPFADSLTTVLSVVAMILSVGRYAEQWAVWIVVDVVSVGMWIVAFATGAQSLATLLMWVVYLINGVIMHFRWTRGASAKDVE